MGLRLRVKYFDANDAELDPAVVEGAYSDEWKRLSTLGHPGTSRPVGVEKLADLHNSLDWGGIEPVNGIRSLELTEKINADTIDAGEIIAGTVNYYFPDPYNWSDCPFSILEGRVVQGQYSSSYISADTAHLNIPTGPAEQNPLDATQSVYLNFPEYIVSLKYSVTTDKYYLLCFRGSTSVGLVAPEVYVKEISIPDGSSFYEETAKFYGYGESNPLYGVFDPQNYANQGWTAVSDPLAAQYFVSPQYVALPESNDGILLINSQGQYIDEALIWDPFSDEITQLVVDESLRQSINWSQISRGYCGLPSDYNYLQMSGTPKMFAVADGTLAMFGTALYVGDELFYSPSDDSMDYAGKPYDYNGLRHAAVYYNGGNDTFNLPSIAAIGTPTFLSIGEGFYIGSNQFSPFRLIAGSSGAAGDTVFASGYTVLHAPINDGPTLPLGSVIVETAIEPPTGAVKMQEFIELY